MRRGIAVYCRVCGNCKAPRGRSVPIGSSYCTRDQCDGYDQEPHTGDLWPGETEAEFGYPITSVGTEEIQA